MMKTTLLFEHPIRPEVKVGQRALVFKRLSGRAYERGKRLEGKMRGQLIAINDQVEAIVAKTRDVPVDIAFDDDDLVYVLQELAEQLVSVEGMTPAEAFGSEDLAAALDLEMMPYETVSLWIAYRNQCSTSECERGKSEQS